MTSSVGNRGDRSNSVSPKEGHLEGDLRSPRTPEAEPELAATTEEIVSAIRALSAVELVKLERYAFFRMRALGGRHGGRDAEDLLREAIAVTLSGARRWKRHSVTFFGHLVGAMRSISSHWAEKAASERELVEERRATGQDFESVPDPEGAVAARETLRGIEDHFASDREVTALLHGFRDGLSGPQVCEANAMPRKSYEAALKRLRRALSHTEREERHG